MLTNGIAVSNEATVRSSIPPAVRLAFYIGSAVFFAAVLYTILTTKEYPPDDPAAVERMKAESAGVVRAFREIVAGIALMPKTMRQLAVVQFFTWFALFCMWLYFVPAVATGVFHGQTLGIHDPVLRSQVESEAGKVFVAKAAAVAKAYEVRKKELAEEAARRAGPKPWSDAFLQMFGLKPAAPDPGERIDQAALQALIASQVAAPREVANGEADSPLVQS